MKKIKVNVCTALDLIGKAMEKEKSGIDIYKELEPIENHEYGFGNTFLYFRVDGEKHLKRLEELHTKLIELKIQKGTSCTGESL